MDPSKDSQQDLLDQIQALQATVAERDARISILEQGETTLEVLRTSMPDLVFVQDAEGRYVDLLAPNDNLLYPAVEEVRGKLVHEVFRAKDADTFMALLQRAIKSGQAEALEYSLRVPAGLRDFSAVCRAAQTSNDELFTVTTVRDVTEQKRLQAELERAHKLEVVGRLASGLAHDFNNLLTGVMGSAQIAQMDLPSDHPSSREMEEIIASCDRASRLTHKLLSFGRENIVQTELLDMNRQIGGLKNLLARLMHEDVTVSYELGSGLGQILADPTQLEQIIVNLAVNARDAMPNGGRLHIITQHCSVGSEAHGPNLSGEYIQMTVSDTGIGISAQDQETIFEPFYTTKSDTGGSGLGLSTVYAIVKQSAGFITLDSQPGVGATFHIYLPMTSQTAPTEVLPVPQPERRRGTETILFIEDEPAILNTYKSLLEQQGYQVLPASCAAEAHAHYAEHGPSISLILSDVILPGKSGPEIVDELNIPEGCDVLYISGQSEDTIKSRGSSDEPVNFLHKPFTCDQLLVKVRAVLDSI